MAYKMGAHQIKLTLQGGTTDTLTASWKAWTDKVQESGSKNSGAKPKQIDSFSYIFQYKAKDGRWYQGSNGSVSVLTTDPLPSNVTYSIPANAKKIRFRVKPVSKTHTVNDKETVYWTYDYSAWIEYTVSVPEITPATPSAPTLELTETNKLKMKITVSGITDTKTKYIGFEVVQDDNKVFYKNVAPKKYQVASMIVDVSPDHRYKVRAKALGTKLTNASYYVHTDEGVYELGALSLSMNERAGSTIDTIQSLPWEQQYEDYSEWSEYSSDITTQPSKVLDPIKIEATSTTSVKISWEKPVLTATGYTVEYTTSVENFGQSESQSVSVDIFNPVGSFVLITGLDMANEWFFRIKATNQSGESEWSSIVSTKLGTVSGPPTTWSSSVTAKIGDVVQLYWLHNSEDSSVETSALLTITSKSNGDITTSEVEVQNDSGVYGSTSVYDLDTSVFSYDTVVTWFVKTMGFIEMYGPASIERMINVYIPPTVSLTFYKQNGWFWDPFNFETDDIYTAEGYFQNPYLGDVVIESFPILIGVKTSPESQKPIECYISIVALDTYEGLDYRGETNTIYAGDEIYATTMSYDEKYPDETADFKLCILPQDITLASGQTYRLVCQVMMDSGLMAVADTIFSVEFDEAENDIDAEISYDEYMVSTYIQPYCKDQEGEFIKDARLAVYRINFDGELTEIASGIRNDGTTHIIDPHPSLNFARYRVVAFIYKSGSFTYSDLVPYPIPETSIVIQWDERWQPFSTFTEDEFVEPIQTGTILKLPFNIDTSFSTEPQVNMVEYIGRSRPVSYYGTQIGETSSFSTDIPWYDENRKYALRKLQRYMGNVYLREPGGAGYWANVKISFSLNHKETVIPVSIEATRVEGGV